jgi:plasmid stabilization system protein ParE
MARPLVFRRGVGRDLATAYAWYQEQVHGLGEEFLAEIDAAFDAIEQFPEMFEAVHGEVRRATVSRFPYGVFYRVDTNRWRSSIQRVIHADGRSRETLAEVVGTLVSAIGHKRS